MTRISAIALALALLGSPAMAQETGGTAPAVAPVSKIKACGAEWKSAKSDETVKAAGWPHYWSVCAKRMKEAKAK